MFKIQILIDSNTIIIVRSKLYLVAYMGDKELVSNCIMHLYIDTYTERYDESED